MVSIVFISHSRALAQSAVDLIRRTVAPDLPLAFCGGTGTDHQELGTDAVDIQEAILKVFSEAGVLVLMDMGSAILSAETAKEFLTPEQQEKIALTSAPLVEGGIAASVQAQLGSPLEEVARAARESLLPKQEQVQDSAADHHLGGAALAAPEPASAAAIENKPFIELPIENAHGLHLRPAATLIKALHAASGSVLVENRSGKRGPVAAKSLVDLTRLQIRRGDVVRFTVLDPDAQPIIEKIQSLVADRFGESETAPIAAPTDTTKPFPVSPGIAIGKPEILERPMPTLPTYRADTPAKVEEEIASLDRALSGARKEFGQRIDRLRSSLGADEIGMFEAQRMILSDPTIVQETESKIRGDHLNAASAFHDVLSQHIVEQEAFDDPYFRARAADLREIQRLIVGSLTNQTERELAAQPFSQPTILICDELTPALAEELQRLSVVGVIQLDGGTTSHGAILARALGIPTIGGARALFPKLRSAHKILFDGSQGSIWIDPELALEDEFNQRREEEQKQRQANLEAAKEPAITLDAIHIEFEANASSAAEISLARDSGATGVGLFRSEFLFQRFAEKPSEQDQLDAYKAAVAPAGESLPITIRVLDIGGDKPLKFLSIPSETNPFLGVRGLRLLAANPDFFRSHLRAILRLAASTTVRLLLPMVTELSEVLATRDLLNQVAGELTEKNLPHRWPIPLGVMIETPAAALLVDQLAPHVDFFSLGTNDLTQYVLCAERGNPALSRFSDAIHPAVSRLCQRVIAVAADRQLKVSICGEVALQSLPIWLGLGLRNLSVTPSAIPAMKALVRQINLADLTAELKSQLDSFTDAASAHTFAAPWTEQKPR
jgi:phosphoenolpyruvate-protein phosphotransferase/dihydroxyacetone kinase phosphotransfer subunit